MKRQPPRGKPSFAPVVDLLRSLEELLLVLAKWVPNELSLPITSAVLHETRRNVSYLVHNGAPTTAMIEIVRLAEDVGRVRVSLIDLGSKSADALTAAGKGRRADIHELAKFLSKGEKDTQTMQEEVVASLKKETKPPDKSWLVKNTAPKLKTIREQILQHDDDLDDDYDF